MKLRLYAKSSVTISLNLWTSLCVAAFSQHATAFAKVNHDQLRVCGCWPHLLFSLSIRSEAFYPTKMLYALIELAQQFRKLRKLNNISVSFNRVCWAGYCCDWLA